jgi:Flp pilus assembly protein TadG
VLPHRARNERGQAIVEFALVVPILVAIVLGIVEFGIAFNHYQTLTAAVGTGARTGAVTHDAASVEGVVEDAAGGLDPSKLEVDVRSDWVSGHTVTVTATYPYSIDILGIVVKQGDLTSKTVQRVE